MTGRLIARVTDTARRMARRPRAWVRAFRAHHSTVAATRAVRNATARAELALRAVTTRRGGAAAWTNLTDEVESRAPLAGGARTVSVVPVKRTDTAATVAGAAAGTTGELVCFLLESTEPLGDDWLARLTSVVDGTDVIAATPVVVHPPRSLIRATPHDGCVRNRGVELTVDRDAPALRARDAGTLASLAAITLPVAGGSAACFVIDRAAYDRAGGLPGFADLDIAIFELGRRARSGGGQIAMVGDCVVADHRPVSSRRALSEPVPTDAPAWRAYVEAHGPELMREAARLPDAKLRFAITVAAPSEKVAARWGDWHFAEALARAIRRLGHDVRVQTLDHADDLAGRSCDVHCVVRGLARVRRTAGQAHVIWVISHPEHIETEECDDADLVLVASTRFAAELRSRTRTPVEVMLQATDETRFHPVPPEARHIHDVAIVAKSRDVFRASVADALAAGLRPAIYGSGWDGLVDPALVVSDYVANEELPTVYSSVRVLLNDHWQSMRTWGFVSNRLFDALACSTPVISDELPEIAELFDGAVLTYRDAAELRTLVDTTLADRAAAHARAVRGGDIVRAHHTFDHRAAELLDALRRHSLIRTPTSGPPAA